MDPEHYYTELAAAYVRGKLEGHLLAGDSQLWEQARRSGLRLHRFKRTSGLPRVQRVLGALKSFRPSTLLDVGSGRGAFLWPLLDQLSDIEITALDVLDYRVDDILAVGRGGITNLRAVCGDPRSLDWSDDLFDAVTVLEVLEHLEAPATLARRALALAKQVVIATVPSKADNNPEHIQLFTTDSFRALFDDAGASKVDIDHVRGHLVAVVRP